VFTTLKGQRARHVEEQKHTRSLLHGESYMYWYHHLDMETVTTWNEQFRQLAIHPRNFDVPYPKTRAFHRHRHALIYFLDGNRIPTKPPSYLLGTSWTCS